MGIERLWLKNKVASTTVLQHSPLPHPDFFTYIWQLKIPSKIQIRIWRIAQNFLPLKANLVKRRLQIDAMCPVCLAADETADQLFWGCQFTKHVLDALGFDSSRFSMQNEWQNDLATVFISISKQQRIVLALTFWATWYFKNRLVREGKRDSFQHVV